MIVIVPETEHAKGMPCIPDKRPILKRAFIPGGGIGASFDGEEGRPGRFLSRKASGAQSCEVKSTNQAAVRILSHLEPGERSGGKLLQLSSDRTVSQPGGETGKEDRIWEGEEPC